MAISPGNPSERRPGLPGQLIRPHVKLLHPFLCFMGKKNRPVLEEKTVGFLFSPSSSLSTKLKLYPNHAILANIAGSSRSSQSSHYNLPANLSNWITTIQDGNLPIMPTCSPPNLQQGIELRVQLSAARAADHGRRGLCGGAQRRSLEQLLLL